MGELTIELGRILEFVLSKLTLSLWNSLTADTQTTIERVFLFMLAATFVFWVAYKFDSIKSTFRLFIIGLSHACFLAIGAGTKELIRRITPVLLPKELAVSLMIASPLLLLASFNGWSYNFYLATRILACGTLTLLTRHFYLRKNPIWAASTCCFAAVLNPIVRFHFQRATWQLIDLLAAALMTFIVYFNYYSFHRKWTR